ncbi:MAG: TetR/AcrR family transcriptional regulator [Firmicutes bacterium]|nr:TetR/AcrR family transcriptional regulator [Bacillota bacterium]
MKYKTEKKLLDGVEKVIEKKKKISVITICEEAGVSRQSFYKYFLDIDDFMFWVHQKLFAESFVAIFKNDSGFYLGSFIALFKTLEKHKKLYREMCLQETKNGFKNVFAETGVLFNLVYNSYINKDEKEIEKSRFNLNLYFRGFLFYLEEFVNNRLNYDVETIANYLVETMPYELKKWDFDLAVEPDEEIIERLKNEWLKLTTNYNES